MRLNAKGHDLKCLVRMGVLLIPYTSGSSATGSRKTVMGRGEQRYMRTAGGREVCHRTGRGH